MVHLIRARHKARNARKADSLRKFVDGAFYAVDDGIDALAKAKTYAKQTGAMDTYRSLDMASSLLAKAYRELRKVKK